MDVPTVVDADAAVVVDDSADVSFVEDDAHAETTNAHTTTITLGLKILPTTEGTIPLTA